MTSLKTFQQEIRDLVFYKEKEREKSFLWKNGIPKRLDVYRNNARLNWSEGLDHDFPLTRSQFSESEWEKLRKRYFVKHPPASWELNTALTPFFTFLASEKEKPYVKELADYEWHDLQTFIHLARVQKGSGLTNPTASVRVYQHQMFDWVQAGTPQEQPPRQKPEVLVFYRDSRHACCVLEADPLMLLVMDHFRRPGASLELLEKTRRKLLPQNTVPLPSVLRELTAQDIILS